SPRSTCAIATARARRLTMADQVNAEDGNLTLLAPAEQRMALRMVEAMLFASAHPLSKAELMARLPEGSDIDALLREIEHAYSGRGVNLVKLAGKYMFRTASDLAFLLQRDTHDQKKLSRAALETLAIIAYH